MSNAVTLTELWRGPFLECTHTGHAVICDESGQVVDAWGDPDAVFMPRSSATIRGLSQPRPVQWGTW